MIIGLSGKKQSGKDTVAKIIQYFTAPRVKEFSISDLASFIDNNIVGKALAGTSNFETKQFAYKLKQIVCLLIGCSIEDLENGQFKEKELGKEWDLYSNNFLDEKTIISVEQYNNLSTQFLKNRWTLMKLTPRKLLQLLGTECGRQIIHPNIWINALMGKYKPIGKVPDSGLLADLSDYYPNWIITDMRFPNELKAVKDKGGVVIRINRPFEQRIYQYDRTCFDCYKGFDFSDWKTEKQKKEQVCPHCGSLRHAAVLYEDDTHESETALDRYSRFDYTVDNDGTLEQLVKSVKQILIDLKII